MLDRIVSDWPLKGLSIALAFGIWASITGEETIRRDFEVALDPALRDNHLLASELPTQVTVRLEGPASVVRKIDPLAMAVRPDLTGFPVGTREIQLTEAHLAGRPTQAGVEFFEPERVRVVVDERRRRMLPLVPDLVGGPPAGYHVYRATVAPDIVEVEGPSAIVNELEAVRTDPVHLDGHAQRFLERVGVTPGASHVRLVQPDAAYEVRVDVGPEPVEQVFEAVPVLGRDGVEFRPETMDVTLAGPPELLRRISRDRIRLRADVADLTHGAGARRVEVDVDLGIGPELSPWIRISDPERLRVTAQVAASAAGSP